MSNVTYLKSKRINRKITTEIGPQEIAKLVSDKQIVILKNVFTENELLNLRHEVLTWGKGIEPINSDDFTQNYHSRRAKISNIQQSPHVFHDYNFNNFNTLPESLSVKLFDVFESLRVLYSELTDQHTQLGVAETGPYFHPQIIHYPLGGGFFGRHNHNLKPQIVGFILAMSKYGVDYKAGGTCFDINGKTVDIEGLHDMGDLCLWRNDLDHWVKQSPLDDKFSWESEKGRFVATLAYFDPKG
jgi:hypothetical protein